jgi:Zn-dependent protease with chaperone function
MSDALARRSDPGPASGPMTRRAQAAELAATRRRVSLLTGAIGVAVPWLIWASGLSGALWESLGGLAYWLAVPTHVGLLALILALVSTPLGYYGGFVIGHRYGLSTQSLGGWLADRLKSTMLIVLLTTVVGSLFYATISTVPAWWPLAFWIEAMAGVILLMFVAPYVLVPIFFKPKPVDDPGVVMMIEDLVRQAGTSVAGVSQLDFSRRTNEANAAVIGFGRSRRVVLGDTLLHSFTPSEIRAVVAHELGHHVHRDVAKLLVAQAVVMAVGLGLASLLGESLLSMVGAGPLGDPASYPLLVVGVSVFSLVCLPAVNAFARAVEADADAYAIALIGDGRPLAAAMRRLADQNLAEERPPRWAELLLYTHPPIWRRVERAEAAGHG